MRRGGRASTIVSIALLFVFLQPAYANGEHVHVGGLFLVLLGGVVFLGSFVVVFYFLLPASSMGGMILPIFSTLLPSNSAGMSCCAMILTAL